MTWLSVCFAAICLPSSWFIDICTLPDIQAISFTYFVRDDRSGKVITESVRRSIMVENTKKLVLFATSFEPL